MHAEKLTSIDDFKSFHKILMSSRDLKIPTIIIPAGTCGQASGANELIRSAKRELLAKNLVGKINLRVTGCHGFCEMEPSVLILPDRTFYPRLSSKDMARIVGAVAEGKVLEDLLYEDPTTKKSLRKQEDIPFFNMQTRTIMSRNEQVDPIRIYNYIENEGYLSLVKALERNDPKWVVDEVIDSGLRGRGGAGFPTGLKWKFLAKSSNGSGKYIVCNADEGDPGAYMDRCILEGNPHSIIEGMLIGAFGTGANEGVIYVRAEYPLAIKHFIIALRQARELGLLGKDILGTGFDFDLEIVKGAGAFVCGEETALIRSIEGKMGEPRQRPPFPVEKGINNKPTNINNVETWVNIPIIFKSGAKEFLKIGTKNNSGTKIFSLVGKIKNTGLVEVPMGITFQDIIFNIGEGSSSRSKIRAVQTGGPSGGCIPVRKFNLPIDYDSLMEAGSIMGSGGMIVMDENTCMVDVAKYFMSFLKDESCGKCFTCRKGTQRMWEILDDITKGAGTPEHLDLLEELACVVKDTSMCGLGQTAANPILSTLQYFREEYLEHILHKRCSAGVCKELVGAPCEAACPLGTEAWRYVANIASGDYEEAYKVIRKANPFPSVCARVCSHPCEEKCRTGTTGGEPVAIRALKRFITDRIDPSVFKPSRIQNSENNATRIAVIGAGPSGLTAAHYLSLKDYKVTVYDKDDRPGGMLNCAIPAYRIPRDTLIKEIESIIDDNISLKCSVEFGVDINLDDLYKEGFKAIYLAMGAHKSKLLNIEGEDLDGVYPALEFLKAFNLRGEKLAKRRVGVIGGGDSAIDAARVALRQEEVESVSILYRRTREEMPALQHEIDAAIEEGAKLITLTSPVRIYKENGILAGIECIQNKLGDVDSKGRRSPVPIPGSEYAIPLDTLIVTIGDVPDVDYISSMGVKVNKWGMLVVDKETMQSNIEGVFAGGDVVTGPNTVIAAIADGKKAAVMIDRYLHNQDLWQKPEVKLPDVYISPVEMDDSETSLADRVKLPTISMSERRQSLEEVEQTLSEERAMYEARRCMRCDLEFTSHLNEKEKTAEAGGQST